MQSEIESAVGFKISDEQYKRAFEYATKKQAYIYKREQRQEVLEVGYFKILITEIVKQFALTDFTICLGKELYNIEKEHLQSKVLPKPSLL